MNSRSLLRSAALSLAVISLTACSTVTTRYYTLAPTDNQAPAPAGAATFQFEMASVRMPVQVDQPQLVVRQSTGTLSILENDRWGAPLADEFHDALTRQLETRLGTRDLAGMPKQAGRPVVTLRTDVRRFDSLPGSYALVDAVWSLSLRSDGQARRTLTCSSVIRQPSGVAIADLVLAHQQVIGQLATVMANTAKRFAAGDTSCP
ncbi:PqiC family protein [Pseudomonas sp. HR96]|uniref:PqiC family protein n=1 Tax=Pseudomonas sp. HR96 TaxID=1027966 RepID=UPI002A74CEE0|nr:PqiC family protein [Pseudomonas sp. HR96]WPO97760.1 PqiC family protein [Pseudomonas sp. HR96]